MKTTIRRNFLALVLVGATFMGLGGLMTQAQSIDDSDAIMARQAAVKKTWTELRNYSIDHSSARVGQWVTVKVQLFYRKQTGPRPGDYVLTPLPGKDLTFNAGFKPKQLVVHPTDRNGWASATFKVPNDLVKRVVIAVKLSNDGQYVGDMATGHFDVIK